MTKNIEDRVALNEGRYRSLADKSVDAVWVLHAETMEYLYVSPFIYELRGFSHEEMIDQLQKTIAEKEKFLKKIKMLESILPIC